MFHWVSRVKKRFAPLTTLRRHPLGYLNRKKMIKIAFTLLVASLSLVPLLSQATFRPIDKSPLDLCYFPDEFAHDRKFAPEKIGPDSAMIRILYSRPARKDREIFGKLIPFGKVWRTGANEAPEIKFYQDVTINGQRLPKGTYALLSIPDEKSWTIIFSRDLDQWGAYSYQPQRDVLRVPATVSRSEALIEHFSLRMTRLDAHTAQLKLGWENTIVTLPIGF